MDNILVYSKELIEHIEQVKKVLDEIRKVGFHISLEKSKFYIQEVEFLGHTIKIGGIAISKDKVEAILNWLEPKTLKEVQSFLGFVNYYRKFIGGYKEVAKPLTNLIRKCQEFIWKHK